MITKLVLLCPIGGVFRHPEWRQQDTEGAHVQAARFEGGGGGHEIPDGAARVSKAA